MSVNIPLAGGVPGIPGPPDWLSASPSASSALDDVRWLGAMRTAFGTGGAGSNYVRAVQDVQSGQQYIYLSFRVAFVPQLSDQYDFIWIGLQKRNAANNNTAMVIRVKVHASSVTPAGPPSTNATVSATEIRTFTRASGAGAWSIQPIASTPSWINSNCRVWLQTKTQVASDPNNRWAMQLRIPAAAMGAIDTTTGPDLGTDFRMWYAIQGTILDNGAPVPAVLADYRTSGVTPDIDLEDGNFPVPFDATSLWDQFLLTSGPGTNGGVAIHGNGSADIRIRNVQYGEGLTIDNGANTMIARPRNYRGAPIAAGDIGATFRIANWGSVAGNPYQTNFASGTWAYVPGMTATTPALSGGQISALTAGTNPIATESIEFPTTLNRAGLSYHQCIFVTLTGTNLQFLNESAFQNMDYETASLVEREAEINVLGPTPQPPAVILGIEKINMLQNVPPGTDEGQFLERRIRELIKAGGPLGEKLKKMGRVQLDDRVGGHERNPEKRRLASLVNALTNAGLSQDEVDQVFPTLRVHCYHDTGERRRNNAGVQVPVYRVQSSFGLNVYHEGPLSGWQTSIQGAVRTADDIYQLAIPASGKAKIKIRIQAVDNDERRIPEDPIKKFDGGGDTRPGRQLPIWSRVWRLLFPVREP